MFAGLRTGEVLALQWQDINFENKTINVERGLTIEPKFNSEGKVIKRITIISETKTTCSKRVVPMPDILINALNDYKQRQSQISNKGKVDLLDKHCFVFANDDGTFRTYSATQKILNRFLKKYKLTEYNIHFHGLRHTYSNMLFEADQNPKVIQALLGHKSVKTTIRGLTDLSLYRRYEFYFCAERDFAMCSVPAFCPARWVARGIVWSELMS